MTKDVDIIQILTQNAISGLTLALSDEKPLRVMQVPDVREKLVVQHLMIQVTINQQKEGMQS